MTKPHEQEWTAVQTSQGTWVRRVDGANDARRMVNVAQVYAPPSEEIGAGTLEERVRMSDAETLAMATRMAASNDMARALLLAKERGPWAEWMEDGKIVRAMDIIDAALRKAGVL